MINLLQTTYVNPGIVSAESSLCATIHWGSAWVFLICSHTNNSKQRQQHTNNSKQNIAIKTTGLVPQKLCVPNYNCWPGTFYCRVFLIFPFSKQQHTNNFQPNIAIKTTSLVSQVPIRPFTPLWHNKTSSNFLFEHNGSRCQKPPISKKKKNYLKLARKHESPPRCFLLPWCRIPPFSRNKAFHKAGLVIEQRLSRSRPILRPPPVFFIALVPKQGLSSSSACHGAGLS